MYIRRNLRVLYGDVLDAGGRLLENFYVKTSFHMTLKRPCDISVKTRHDASRQATLPPNLAVARGSEGLLLLEGFSRNLFSIAKGLGGPFGL